METMNVHPYQFQVANKTVTVYPGNVANCPVIYLNTCQDDDEVLLKALGDAPAHSLVVIRNLDWDHDMSPWPVGPICKGDTPCTGGAGDYLQLLVRKIVPAAEKLLHDPVSWRGLAGYSLAGLFAVCAIYNTNLFTRIASISGSLWYPDLKQYVISHDMKVIPTRMYFSLGDSESKTNNPYLKSVLENTEAIEAFYRKQGIDTVFKLNPGNHFNDAIGRTAAGIKWLLEDGEDEEVRTE